jgi:signal transduction histidine kinase/HPt (histidine-containing phosphotransfer) domain-containing protein/ActR/RegA family two-component response regulator
LKRIVARVTGQALLLPCILAVIWGAIWIHLGAEYRHAVQDAVERSMSLSQLLEENMSRAATVLDTALLNSRATYLHDKDGFKVGPWMRDEPMLMKIAVQMSITNASGIVVTASGDNGPPPANIADREHFRIQANASEDRLFISVPVIGRTTGRLSIQFTRRIVNPDGSFAGVAVVSFDPFVIAEFQNGGRLDGGFTMLVGDDGIIRAAQPDTTLIGKTFSDTGILQKIAAAGNAPLAFSSKTDGAIASYRTIAGYKLFVAAGFPESAVFAPYDRERAVVLLAGTVLSLTVLLVGAIMLRQRRELTRFHQALLLTMDNISQGILMIDQRRHMPVVNRRVAQLLGLPVELASPGGNFDALVEWQQQHGIATAIDDAAIDPNVPLYVRTGADGSVLEVRTTVLPDGNAVRTLTDVTERKRIEREMADARDAAQSGVRARTEFLAVMSHEIRTPLNGIIGAAGLLQDMRLDPEQRDYVRVIRESGGHLASVIQDILDFSRLDGGRLKLDPAAFDPRALILSTIAMLEGQARAMGLTLTAGIAEDMQAQVVGDSSRLRQILVKLIDNAIKFTNAGGITVSARMTSVDPQTATLDMAVTDSGIGIATENQQKLFSAFTQVDGSISRRVGGTGLGLAICRHLVTLMGGTIDVESTPGRGSTFRFDIQLRRVAAEQAVQPSDQPAPKPVRRLKILLAEDNPTNRHVATRMLARMGHMVDAVEDGAKAIGAAEMGDYDVILMDVMMPEVDGLTATRTIRAGEQPRCNIVIIGLTANALPADRDACIAAGMNDFITKPVTLERLRSVLEQTEVAGPARPEQPATICGTVTLDAAFLLRLSQEIGLDGVAEMVNIFLEDAPARMAAIRRGVANGASQTVRREAHALAGAASNVGLSRLSEAAGALQNAIERTAMDATDIEAVAAAFNDSLPLVAEWVAAHEGMEATGV